MENSEKPWSNIFKTGVITTIRKVPTNRNNYWLLQVKPCLRKDHMEVLVFL